MYLTVAQEIKKQTVNVSVDTRNNQKPKIYWHCCLMQDNIECKRALLDCRMGHTIQQVSDSMFTTDV
jgi:hypothetical protein